MRTEFSLRDLEIFHAIATTGSTRQAAVQLGLTQSAVSHALARLEESLKIRLFARENQRLQITAAGRYMLNEAILLMGNLARIEEDLFVLQDSGVASLKLGCAPGLGHRFGPALVQRYLQAHPGIAVSLDVAASGRLIADVEAGRLDMALVSYEVHEPNLLFAPMVAARMRVLMPSASALAEKVELELTDLDGQTLIKPIQSDHLIYRDNSLRRLLRHELQSSLSSMGAMIEMTGGLSLVNAITAADLCEKPKLVSRPFALEQWFNFYLVYKQELKSNRLIGDVRLALAQVVEAMQQREDCAGALRLPAA
ncbi:LysR family transcriptional regulator [Pseudomonas sp. AU11447]|uniref:LysR family transcriptional regulator n=1 Tax=unclassified Pseudomonas TaxID=196821 RepID=UPI0006D3F840|nr:MULTISPECIES: LysR family transcriptional regulator [unclassified Pseudomonas]OBY88906.1 LysR family transcriptional regulator [Pseudomonas sp. AU11447]